MSIVHETYPGNEGQDERIITESSAIGDYEDSLEKPGSSFLWVGRDHHLNREEIVSLALAMLYWAENSRLPESMEKVYESDEDEPFDGRDKHSRN